MSLILSLLVYVVLVIQAKKTLKKFIAARFSCNYKSKISLITFKWNIMKKNLTLILALLICLAFEAQTQLATSKTIVGMWNQTAGYDYEVGNTNLESASNFYKIINPDGTFFTFVSTPKQYTGDTPIISQYGTYKIDSDNGTLTEHIDGHVINPRMVGKNVTIKYELKDENTLLLSWTPNGKISISETWTRVPSAIPSSEEGLYQFLFR